jgi:hypothetical protein
MKRRADHVDHDACVTSRAEYWLVALEPPPLRISVRPRRVRRPREPYDPEKAARRDAIEAARKRTKRETHLTKIFPAGVIPPQPLDEELQREHESNYYSRSKKNQREETARLLTQFETEGGSVRVCPPNKRSRKWSRRASDGKLFAEKS